MKNLNKFFNPKSIAIVGASPKKEKLGNVLTQNILTGGWKGKLYFVNPKYKRVGAEKCYAGLREIKKPVDLVLIAIPASSVNQILEEGAQASPKIENYVVISSGFKETGKEGQKLEEELKNISEKYKLNVLGPNCLGFISQRRKLNATFTSGKFKSGKVAIVSQSGALAVALLDWAQNISLGFSRVISIGNKATLDESDIVNFLSEDKDTETIALYLEDIKDGARFFEAVGKASQKKPIVVLKAGKTIAGQKAIASHTGSLAQDEAIVEAVFEKLNVIEAKNIEEFQDLVLFSNSGGIPKRDEVIIITNAGGPGVLASDFIGKSKLLKLKKISTDFKNKFRQFLPDSASVENPIDIIGDAAPDRYENVLKALSLKYLENPLLVILTPQTQTNPEKVAKIISHFKKNFPVLITSFMGGIKVKKAIEYLQVNGIANFESPERALLVLEKIISYYQGKIRRPKISFPKVAHLNLEANLIIQSALEEKRKIMLWKETEKLFGNYGIKLAKSLSFQSWGEIEGAKIRYPCALKTDDPRIIHRWDKKAVILDIRSERELKNAFNKMRRTTGARNFLVQSMVKPGLEMIIGIKRDKAFGSVIIAGWGGTLAEIFADRVILIPPLTMEEIKNELNNLKISPVLRGFRGEKSYNLQEIAKIILALQQLSAENPDISQIDINPVVLYNNGKPYQILDAKIYL